MPGRQAPAVHVTARQEELLRKLVRGTTAPQRLAVRAQIVLLAAAGHSSEQIAGKLVVIRPMVRKWPRRWSASQDQLRVVEGEESDSAVQSRICEILADAPRCGRPSDISPEQILEIIALRRSRGRAATVQPLDTRRGGPRVCAPRDYREHLHPICGSFFKRRPILDRTACATGCNWTKLTRRRSTQRQAGQQPLPACGGPSPTRRSCRVLRREDGNPGFGASLSDTISYP